jgi:hypothetical protein
VEKFQQPIHSTLPIFASASHHFSEVDSLASHGGSTRNGTTAKRSRPQSIGEQAIFSVKKQRTGSLSSFSGYALLEKQAQCDTVEVPDLEPCSSDHKEQYDTGEGTGLEACSPESTTPTIREHQDALEELDLVSCYTEHTITPATHERYERPEIPSPEVNSKRSSHTEDALLIATFNEIAASNETKTGTALFAFFQDLLEGSWYQPLWIWTDRDYTNENSLRPKRLLDSSRLIESFSPREWDDMKIAADFLYCLGLSEDAFVLYVLLLRRLRSYPPNERNHSKIARAAVLCAFSATTDSQIEVSQNLLEQLIKDSSTSHRESNLYNALLKEIRYVALGYEVMNPHPNTSSTTRYSLRMPAWYPFIEVEPEKQEREISAMRVHSCLSWCTAILFGQNLRPNFQSAFQFNKYTLQTGCCNQTVLYVYLWQCFLMKDLYTEFDFWKTDPENDTALSAPELLFVVTCMILQSPTSVTPDQMRSPENVFVSEARKGAVKHSDALLGGRIRSEHLSSFASRSHHLERVIELKRGLSVTDALDYQTFRELGRVFVQETLAVRLQDMTAPQDISAPQDMSAPYNMPAVELDALALSFKDNDNLENPSSSEPTYYPTPTMASSLRSSQVSSYRRLKRLRERILQPKKPSHDSESTKVPSSVLRDPLQLQDSHRSIDQLSMSFASSMSISSKSFAASLRRSRRPNLQSYQQSSDVDMLLDMELRV